MKKKQEATANSEAVVQIKPPKFQIGVFRITGTAPLVINKFPQKALEEMAERQRLGSQAKKGKQREGKDFEALYQGARHISREGWDGIPASAFRNAAISACRLVGFKMTLAKLSLFIEADGFDKDEGTPLVRITKGTPRPVKMAVRNATGVVDVRVRPLWDEWSATVRVRFDADQFSLTDVANLLHRVGSQVGLCEGRPDSKDSAGMGWGLFEIEESKK